MLSDANRKTFATTTSKTSQCTFWCSVLSDLNGDALDEYLIMVSMHLLVLSACRLSGEQSRPGVVQSQCTFWCSVLSDKDFLCMTKMTYWSLNAPSGAQCFPTGCGGGRRGRSPVSMHLLVLSAFRLERMPWTCTSSMGLNAPSGAQCFPTTIANRRTLVQSCVSMHLLVLSAFRRKVTQQLDAVANKMSQCTFWCSVLSDHV